MMKMNKWTLGLAAVGLVTIPFTMQAEEKMSQMQTALSSTTISGYVNTSAQWQIGKANGYNPPGYAFNTASKQDGFNMNVVNLTIEKPLDAADSWAAGYKIETLYGPDAVGWNSSFNGAGNSDFGIKQAYVALRAPVGNGLDFKIGTFDTIIGYESFNAGSNPNYTRSWGYTFEPTQHTGLLASYQFCKEIGIAGGVANTANAGINNRSFLTSNKSETDKTYMGAITLTAPDSFGSLAGSTLYGGVVNGFNNGVAGSNMQDGMLWFYGGLTLNTPVKGLKTGLAYDHISNSRSAEGNIGQNYTFNSAGLYVSFQATEKLSFHARGEYVWSNLPHYLAWNTGTAVARNMLALTATVQYDLWANVLSRLEVRWDRDLTGDYYHAFNDADQNAIMVAANIIYKF